MSGQDNIDFRAAAEESGQILRLAGVIMNFSPPSLLAIDIWFDTLLGRGLATPEKRKNHQYLEWEVGCYLGEVLCQRLGGQWRPGEKDRLLGHVVWPSGFATCPFAYITKRLDNGSASSLYAQFEQCRQLLVQRKDISDAPDDPIEWLKQGEVYGHDFNRIKEALRFTQKALQIDPKLAVGWLRFAQYYSRSKEGYAIALEYYGKALLLDNSLEEAWAGRCCLLLASGAKDKARTCVKDALAKFPENTELNEIFGDMLLEQEDYKGASVAYTKAVGKAGTAKAWESLGLCRQALGDVAGAIDAWDRALQQDGSRYRAAFELAAAKEQLGAKQEAVQLYQYIVDRNIPEPLLLARAVAKIKEIENDPALLREKAGRLASSNDPKGAVELYEKLVAINPKDADAWREAGVGHAMMQEFDRALSCFDKAIKLDPKDYRGYDHKAVTLGRMGRFPAGLDVIEQGLFSCLNSAQLWSRQSFFLGKTGRWKQSLQSAKKALEIDPEESQVLIFKAEAEKQLGMTAEAIATLDSFISIRRDNNPQSAIEGMRRRWELQNPGKSLDPQRAMQLQDYAFQLWDAGQPDKALQAFKEATQNDPFSFEIWNNYGSYLSGAGQVQEALSCFEKAAELFPGIPTFIQNKARMLFRLGRYEEALACHDEALKKEPGNRDSLLEKSHIFTTLNRFEDALAALNSLEAVDQRDPKLFSRKGWCLCSMKRYDEALSAYDKAISLSPNDRNLWMDKSVCLSDMGRTEESLELQAKAFEDPEFAEKYYQEGLRMFDFLTGGDKS
ncbi:MAG: tetratricopeptide repeat protein [Nitrospirae bacterium]|nr:MAG: tetratricopeptide repeat protein [Nitrospirota bacterium]